ncbi:MAG: hypothetical protein H6581_23080 [Bacteroidia bacterium]|nr:hypothetical protein [Bacteroidia bacterium]
MKAFVTISTRSHLPAVRALRQSLADHAGENSWEFYALFTEELSLKEKEICIREGILLLEMERIAEHETGNEILQKYQAQPDELRWSLKPMVLLALLEKGLERVIYLDNDLFFFGKWQFLFDQMADRSILLCPHWRISDPKTDPDWFCTNFKDGVFNAGFVGVTREGREIMEWWAKVCAWKCEKNPGQGLFDDQKYLDLVPARFEGVEVLTHRGCNVAYWNRWENQRVVREGKVLINGKFPVIFIHFTADLIRTIEDGSDAALGEYLEKYRQAGEFLSLNT